MNECLYCKGHLEARLVSRVQAYHGRWYLIEHVPALVCSQCGETFYTPQAHDLVLSLVREAAAPVRIDPLTVLDAS
ncbi:MAG: YgiT-type zinc finger protein [Anaerolineae bacterium]|nr:YgiT-type zinc finger protein [Anaerolineae bacterium]NUQ05768.1 YgiT-type zinc finger protein [Anaerolineae bacterium]